MEIHHANGSRTAAPSLAQAGTYSDHCGFRIRACSHINLMEIRTTATTNALGHVTQHAFDSMNRLTRARPRGQAYNNE